MDQTKSKQHTLWLLAGLSAPLAHYAGSGWYMTALAALAVLPLTLLPKRWEGMGKPLALIEIIYLGAVAGMLLRQSAAYWPSDNDLAVPLTLLVLAALTKESSAPRIGAVLAFCMALLAIPVAGLGASRVEPEWLRPHAAPWPMMLSLVLLLPNLTASGEGPKGRRVLAIGSIAVLLSLLVQGIIGAKTAASVPDPFYQTARTLGHLEPIIASGITLGWYAMTVYLLTSAGEIARGNGIRKKYASVLAVGTAAICAIFLRQPDSTVLTVLSAFLWVLIPFLNKIRKSKKEEK